MFCFIKAIRLYTAKHISVVFKRKSSEAEVSGMQSWEDYDFYNYWQRPIKAVEVLNAVVLLTDF